MLSRFSLDSFLFVANSNSAEPASFVYQTNQGNAEMELEKKGRRILLMKNEDGRFKERNEKRKLKMVTRGKTRPDTRLPKLRAGGQGQ